MENSASISRRIFFKSRGGTYSAIFMADCGDLFQQYTGTATSMTGFFPKITESNPINLNLTITSSNATGVIVPESVTYNVAGQDLSFNVSGAVTSPSAFAGKFRMQGGVLQVIGNIADIAQGAGFLITATAKIRTSSGYDTLVAHLSVSVSPYIEGDSAVVTIAPGDDKNFTLTSDTDSVKLVAKVFENGDWITSGLTYAWYQLTSSGWNKLTETGNTLTVHASMVDTYGDFRVTVSRGSTEIGSDTQGVMDASDPFDILTVITLHKGGGQTDTNDGTLTSDMADTDFLRYACSMVRRGSTSPLDGVTWENGVLVSADGLELQTVIPKNGNLYEVTVGMLRECGGEGEYELILSCYK